MSQQPMSRESIEKKPRTRGADNVVASVCPYCAVGCSQLVYVKDRRIIDVEGNPDSPIKPHPQAAGGHRGPLSAPWGQPPGGWGEGHHPQPHKETPHRGFRKPT